MPLGPSVDLTRSPSASAPTNEERRAFSAFSSVAYACIRAERRPAVDDRTHLVAKDVHRHGWEVVEEGEEII